MSHSLLPSASLTLAALDWRLLQPEDLPAMHALHLRSIKGMAAQTVKPETREFLHGLLLGRGRVIGAWHGAALAAYGVLQHDLLAQDDPRALQYRYGGHARYLLARVPGAALAHGVPARELAQDDIPGQEALLAQGWQGIAPGQAPGSLRLVAPAGGGQP